MVEPLLNAKEAAARMGISYRTFARQSAWVRRQIAAPNPIGQRRYIAAAIDALNAGKPLARLVRRP